MWLYDKVMTSVLPMLSAGGRDRAILQHKLTRHTMKERVIPWRNESYHEGTSCSWIELVIKVWFKRGNDIYLKLNRFKIFERVEEDIYLKRCLAVANCSNHSKVSNIWLWVLLSTMMLNDVEKVKSILFYVFTYF